MRRNVVLGLFTVLLLVSEVTIRDSQNIQRVAIVKGTLAYFKGQS